MDILNLAQEIIHGKRLTREDDLSFFLTCDLEPLCQGADEIRKACVGDKVDLCSIINGRYVPLSTASADAAPRTANTARSPRTITRNATFTTFSPKRRS